MFYKCIHMLNGSLMTSLPMLGCPTHCLFLKQVLKRNFISWLLTQEELKWRFLTFYSIIVLCFGTLYSTLLNLCF